MDRPWTLKLMVFLALVQGVVAFARAFNWVRVGSDLLGEGMLLVPLVGAVAILRGLFTSVVAGLYLLFAGGALLGKPWARWCCWIATIVNLLLALNGLFQGAALLEVIAWSIIPVVLIICLLSASGQNAFKCA